jgi:tRNA(His) guanylyltransferase
MAKSRYEYVKEFESDPLLLPECWIAVRIDGHSFHKCDCDSCLCAALP